MILYTQGIRLPGDTKTLPAAAPEQSDYQITVNPSSILLFRYSALTFNGHRIHYDLDYCRNVEGYPGLVLHAPLTVTLMLNLARSCFSRRKITFSEFDQQSISPLYHDQPFTLHLKGESEHYEIWATDPDQNLAAKATLVVCQESVRDCPHPEQGSGLITGYSVCQSRHDCDGGECKMRHLMPS